MTLDELMNDSLPKVFRHTSTTGRSGYYWDEEWCLWMEGDDAFRKRIKQEAMLKNARLGDGLLQ